MGRVLRLAWWLSTALIGWTYVGFPLTLLVRARLWPRPIAAADAEPSVSMVIAAHNEARVIGAKLENALGLDYPRDRLEVIVGSDGSDDGTDEIVAGFADRGVVLRSLPRSGKAAALEAAVEAATGSIVVFSDANSEYDRGAIRALVRPFADPTVGGVAGDQRYVTGAVPGEGSGERDYWDLDRRLKVAESAAGNVISATGAIYALRRDLVPRIPPGVTDDFTTSTAVIDQGFRLVFAPDAVAWERVAKAGRREYARKVRIMTRGFRAVALRRGLLDPRRTGFYAVQLLTHKLLRRLMVLPLAVLAVCSPLLWRTSLLYRVATMAQASFYGLAAVNLLTPDSRLARARPAALAGFFVATNAAAAHALRNVLSGKRIDRWDPTDREDAR
jgi:glycosyltransferase involved in cell wall biosynthesis